MNLHIDAARKADRQAVNDIMSPIAGSSTTTLDSIQQLIDAATQAGLHLFRASDLKSKSGNDKSHPPAR